VRSAAWSLLDLSRIGRLWVRAGSSTSRRAAAVLSCSPCCSKMRCSRTCCYQTLLHVCVCV
jgi:hypothetical protein